MDIVWHEHHIVPSYDGGTDDKSNILRCNVAMHAFLHWVRWREKGQWQDEVAYKGLLKIIDDPKSEAIKRGATMGAAITNNGFCYTDGQNVIKCMPGNEPEGWVRASQKEVWYIRDRKEKDLTKDGRKTRKKKNWFTNGVKEGQFDIDCPPSGWKRGRLNTSLLGLK